VIDIDSLNRTALLIGSNKAQNISNTKVIIFGVGGVGSWCAEALVRSGISHLTIVDPDKVVQSNINRQLQATTKTLGQFKADVITERLREINPDAVISTIKEFYSADNFEKFNIGEYDYIIDAIDSIQSKIDLIIRAHNLGVTIYSSMGAACRMDPTRIKIGNIWDTVGCKLSRAVRSELRKKNMTQKHICVWSDETLPNLIKQPVIKGQKRVNGSIMHITAIFGIDLAYLVINDIINSKLI